MIKTEDKMKTRNIFGIFLVSILALMNSCTPELGDMSAYDEWLGKEFNQEILWNVDSMAFRRTDWTTKDVVSGVQMKQAQVKMWESMQSISYITYSPNMFNTHFGYSGEEGTVAEIAGGYENALFAINAGALKDGKPTNYFKLDKEVITSTSTSEPSDAIIGLTATTIGVDMKISSNLDQKDEYTSAMVVSPLILRNGKEVEIPTGEYYDTRMARSILGVTSTGNYIMAVIDAGVDGKADGATAKEAAFIARMMGLDFAVLLGCGDESTLWSADNGVLNAPSAGSAKKVGTVIYVAAGTSRVEGDGTANSPYLLENHVHLTQMRTLAKEGKTTYFRLNEDVDMSPVKVWTPVNFDGEFTRQVHFDGNNKTISNFAPVQFLADDQATDAAYPSMFGVLWGECRDLTIEDSKIVVSETTPSCGILGGFVGTSNKPAVVENVHIKNAEVVGGSNLGIFGGQSRDASYKNCSASGTVVTGGTDAAGMVGKAAGQFSMENCTADVHVSASKNPGSNMRYGGLVGYAATIGGADLTRDKLTLKNCHTSGTIFNNAYSCNCSAGVIAYVGMPEALISKCSTSLNIVCESTGMDNLHGKLSNTGGIVGTCSPATSCTIENCCSSGSINVWQCSAGIVGRHEKGTLNITNCYSTSDILGYSGLGGIVGQSAASLKTNITKSFAWNPSIVAFRDAGDKYSSGAFAGSISGTNTISGCFRNPDLQFTDPFRTIQTHADLAAGTPEGSANQHAYDSTPSAEKTLTDAAKKAGWSSDIWDFSGAVPVLKR